MSAAAQEELTPPRSAQKAARRAPSGARRAANALARSGRLLALPSLVWWLAFFVAPVGVLLSYSLFVPGESGGVLFHLTGENYRSLVDGLYLNVFLRSAWIAALTTLLALVLGYPVAYFIATRPRRWRTPLLLLVIVPMWTSLLIRSYSWQQILNDQGLINKVLSDLGLTHRPLHLLYTSFAVVVGLLAAWLPLMILPLYAGIERLGSELIEAAGDLGSGPLRTFRTVVFPLTRTAALAGAVFVFVPSFGNFLVPDLLGGGRATMVGNLIQQSFFQAQDWPLGAAFGVVVVLVSFAPVGALLAMAARRREGGLDV